MKILLVSSNSGSRGGGEIYLERLAAGLTALEHEVHALLASDPSMDELAARLASSADVHRLAYRNMYRRPLRVVGALCDRRQIARLEKEFRQLAPDLLHLNQQVAEDGLDLVAAAGRTVLPTVSTIHIPGSPTTLGAVAGRLRQRVAQRVMERSSALHICVSQQSADALAQWLPFLRSDDRLCCVHNGVPAAPAGVEAEELRRRFRTRWGVAEHELVLGCVGRIEAQKNPLFVIELLAALEAQSLPVRGVWIGDGHMRGAVEAAVQRHGLGERFHFDGWQDDAAKRLLAFDVFLMPSNFEGLPLALLEALAAGLACCASGTDGIPEAITDGQNGRLCVPGDLSAWIETLAPLLNDVDTRRRLGSAAADTARRSFSVETMARRTVAVYDAALERQAARRA